MPSLQENPSDKDRNRSAGDQISDDAARDALRRILDSPNFAVSERNRRFLSYVVEETLAGRSDRIKAYTIAVDVFNRDRSFDAASDPLIRIEAGRLRRGLEHYYLTAGRDDPVRITIPKGGYVPEFIAAPPPEDPEAEPAAQEIAAGSGQGRKAWHREIVKTWRLSTAAIVLGIAVFLVPAVLRLRSGTPLPEQAAQNTGSDASGGVFRRGTSILVLPFSEMGDRSGSGARAEILREQIIGGLTRFDDIIVLGSAAGQSGPAAGAPAGMMTEYVLQGSVRTTNAGLRVTAVLMDPRQNRYVWSDTLEPPAAAGGAMIGLDGVAGQIVRILAQPYGVIFVDGVRRTGALPPERLSSYQCLLRFNDYWRRPLASGHAEVFGCLQQAVRADPNYASIQAALALMYIDEYRYGYTSAWSVPDPLLRAEQLAFQARRLDPVSERADRALGYVAWFHHDIGRTAGIFEQALARNPNDSDLLLELGTVHSLTGNWDKGLPLVRKGVMRNPDGADIFRLVLVLDAYMRDDYRAALDELARVNMSDFVLTHMMLAMTYGQTGQQAEAQWEVRTIERLAPGFGGHVGAELDRRNMYPAMKAKILDGLRKAGLPGTPAAPSFGSG
jgi:adenylate cyclase